MPCACFSSQRCLTAWQLRADLATVPVDGTLATEQHRRQIALAYTRHLQDAGIGVSPGTLLWPLWYEGAYAAPQEGS